ncbi:beta-propeller fold lactonase family protein [Hazenella sp. IB182353]|uniref:beta-propeller fold lactonase family protein n=1 Tax=Polycladospora coralii TaxID=2771432 RepID=UPI0017471443|nr:beta-propeller fold lactonase family protein [Polycladospora coralii]MBS7531691.1 beta-propeller fold lactonase family protein [Polycladospora coralii]
MSHIYVLNNGAGNPDGTLSVIDGKTHTLIANISVGPVLPYFVKVTPNGKYVYIAALQTITVIDTKSLAVMAVLPSGSGSNISLTNTSIVFTPDSQFAYIGTQDDSFVVVIDVKTHTLIARIYVGSTPNALVMTPNGQYVYVATGGSQVLVIETQTHQIIATIAISESSLAIDIMPNGEYIYVANTGNMGHSPPLQNEKSVAVIDSKKHQIIATVSTGFIPTVIKVTPDSRYVYVGSRNSGTITVIDTKSNKPISTISFPPFVEGIGPETIIFTPDSQVAYIGNILANTIGVISTKSHRLIAYILVPPIIQFTFSQPYRLAITASGRYVYSANRLNHNVSVVQTKNHTVISTIQVGIQPTSIAVTP